MEMIYKIAKVNYNKCKFSIPCTKLINSLNRQMLAVCFANEDALGIRYIIYFVPV